MIIDKKMQDVLMTWARQYAPYATIANYPHRRVRLEIAAEPLKHFPAVTWIVARAYLAEPRCWHSVATKNDKFCECGPLAEQRLG